MRYINYVVKPATIDNAKPKGKRYDLTDGDGLVLEVMPSGSKTWRFKYHLNGKREKVTIGAYPAFTIQQARDRHEELRALVERGQSPAKANQALSTEQKVAEARRLSFRIFAQRWVDETLFYRSGGYEAQTVHWLDAYVHPVIGDMQLDEVQPGDVLAIIKARADTAVTPTRTGPEMER
jgi:Arm DNA-binding domain